MNVVDLIERKRDGGELRGGEIAELIGAYTGGSIPDYQMASLAMAIVCRGMSADETMGLTAAMLDSGDRIEWPEIDAPIVDKHSTGGIGDKVSLVLAPLLAATGVVVPMVSGRGLGATGGTVDKLEAIEGFRCELSVDAFRDVVRQAGCAIVAAGDRLAPADRKLYALRDVTGTVPSIPLITASILSKKLAAGIGGLVLDVKTGSGAFMKRIDQARELARSLVDVATGLGTPTVARITAMDRPLGRMIGNACEVREAVDVLRGADRDGAVRRLTIALGVSALQLAGTHSDAAEAARQLDAALDSGAAFERFERMVRAQGGDPNRIAPLAEPRELTAERDGFLAAIDAERLGRAVVLFGGGRRQLGDRIDPSVGIEMLVDLGARVERGQPLVRMLLSREPSDVERGLLADALRIDDSPPSILPLLIEEIDATNREPRSTEPSNANRPAPVAAREPRS
ncbi:MAG TPA: thymidine phosphorylase [Pirellulaceae bacterium]|nr:thymidine phosphorylase [Pirellulaceae bacterium]